MTHARRGVPTTPSALLLALPLALLLGLATVALGASPGIQPGASPGIQPGAAQGIQPGAAPGDDLRVPFVPQGPALCGGAAVAMVLRYWGERGIYAEDFAHLVVETGEGIRTSDLVSAVVERGWRAGLRVGVPHAVGNDLASGIPVIALIQVAPEQYHYVVLVAWRDGRVRFHDPARGPWREAPEADFLAAWQTTGHWAMVALPDAGAAEYARSAATDDSASARESGVATARVATDRVATDGTTADSAVPGDDGCAALVGDAVAAARSGHLAAGEEALLAARALCPDHREAALELAGLRFRQERYAEAAELAADVVAGQPDLVYGWDLLGSSRYLMGDSDGALRAWNRLGRPVNDLTRIDGLRATRYAVVDEVVAIPPGTLVDAGAMERAQRRVAALPTVARARVDYRPLPDGDAEVHVALAERPTLPRSRFDAIAHGVRALSDSRARLELAGPMGAGELWHLEGVWQRNRHAVEVGLAVPGAFGVPGVWELRARQATATFATPGGHGDDGSPSHEAADRHFHETRRYVSLAASDWASANLRWLLHGSADEWDDHGSFAGLGAGLELRTLRDHVALRLHGTTWRPTGADARPFHRGHAGLAARGGRAAGAFDWDARAGIAAVSRHSPASLWTGAGTGRGSQVLLRAHRLVDGDGVVRGHFHAPRMGYGSLELRRWFDPLPGTRVGVATFVDAVSAGGTGTTTGDIAARSAVDAGIGLRLRLPGLPTTIRVDAATSLTHGSRAVSIGLTPEWPG